MADDRMKQDDQQRNMAGGQEKEKGGYGQQAPGRGGQQGGQQPGQQGQQGGQRDRKAWKTTTNSPLAVRDRVVDSIVAVRTASS